jgi:hypothetical protein
MLRIGWLELCSGSQQCALATSAPRVCKERGSERGGVRESERERQIIRESESESQRVRESESQRAREPVSQRVRGRGGEE